MRRRLTLALALLASSPAFAQVRAVTELALPSAPAIAPSKPIMPAFSMPALGPALSAPSLAASPLLAAPAPVTAQTALIATGSALTAAAKENRDQGSVSREAFDAGAKTLADAPEVAAPAPSGTYQRLNPVGPQGQVAPRGPRGVKTAVIETAEVATMTIPFAFAALIMRGMMSDSAILVPSMLALWALGAWAMRSHLAGLRSTVVDGWQASHDQKYRTDYNTGRLRDVRGKKYGEDRYDKWADGPVGPRAMTAISAAAAAATAAFLLLGR